MVQRIDPKLVQKSVIERLFSQGVEFEPQYLSDEDHDKIIEEVHRREILDFDKEQDDKSFALEGETNDDDDQ